MRQILILVTVLAISGCGGYGYYLSNYNSLPQHDVELNGTTYVVFDRSEVNSLYIRGAVSDTYEIGKRISTNRDATIRDLKVAANKYLNSSGRKDCMFDKGKEIMNGQFEFNYKCS